MVKYRIYINQPPIKIRRKLDVLCIEKNYPFNHPINFKQVFFPEFEGKLKVLSAPPPPLAEKQYNCFAYALGLKRWVRTAVMAQAIKNGELISTNDPKQEDIVVYYENKLDYIRHAGRYISDEKVASKWAGGPIFEHSIFMCPLTYGNRISYFKAINNEEAEKLLNKYSHLNK